jgi:hypothetical protein
MKDKKKHKKTFPDPAQEKLVYPAFQPQIQESPIEIMKEPEKEKTPTFVVHHNKKLKDYLFEFLMLFLAVTAGFFVDNMRENLVERTREKEFIHSMAEDLKGDIHQIDSLLAYRLTKQQMMDSMLFILASPNLDQYGNQLYYYARVLPRITKIYSNDGTITQLKNAGNLRLIRSIATRESIMEYDRQSRFWNSVEEREETLIGQYYPFLKSMFDARVFDEMVDGMAISRPKGNPHLLITDQQHILELYSQVHFLKNVNSYQIALHRSRHALANRVLETLKKEYHVK